jgi:hypothetical protein
VFSKETCRKRTQVDFGLRSRGFDRKKTTDCNWEAQAFDKHNQELLPLPFVSQVRVHIANDLNPHQSKGSPVVG